jgi:hypothetical protein
MLLQSIASEVQSESKWKQLGELAMSTGKVLIYLRIINLSLSDQNSSAPEICISFFFPLSRSE